MLAAWTVCEAARNGDVVVVSAECDYLFGAGDPASEPASTSFALASPLRRPNGSPVYLAQGWERNNGLAAGMTVRAYVLKDGQAILADGVQLSDGRVMVDGEILERAGP